MAVKTRWDQKTYRRHMFNRGRGVRSPHDVSNTKLGTAEFVDSKIGDGSWWEASWRSPWAGRLDAVKEYEQYNNPASAGWSPFTLDSTERKQFREQDRKEVRDLFQKQLANHHFSKHKKLTGGQLDKIVDAYMSQDDDKFQATLAGMGFSDKDAGRVRRAAEESATAAIEGTKYGTKWDDDDYAKQPGAKLGTVAAGNQPGQAGQGGTVTNGQPKAGQPGAAQGQALTPRQPGAKEARHSATAASTRRPYQRPGASYNDLDGAHVRQGSSAETHTEQSLAARAQTMALRDQQEAQNQVARSAHSQYGAYQEGQNERERIEQMGEDRRARQAAEREAAARRRADKRFADRTLYNEADWKNLGREGSNKADYSARKDGESIESWSAREKAIKERQGRMDALLKRLDDMRVQDAEKNSFYANDPNKQQNLARLRGLIVGDDGKVRGDITDAQIEGANATLDAWKKGADEKGARNEAFRKMKDATEISRLRGLYGMGDTSVWSPEDVRERHRSATAAARREIMKGMQVAPGTATQDTAGQAGGAAMAKYAQGWQKLLDNGFDPMAEFREMMGSTTKNEAGRTWKDLFKDASASISTNDPDFADKQDQLKRRFILSWAMNKENLAAKEAGKEAPFKETGGESGAAGADLAGVDNFTKALPGKAPLVSREVAEKTNPLQPKQLQPQAQLQPQQTPGVQIFANAADAMKARDAANAAAGVIKPRSQTRLRPGDKREETMAW